MPVEAVTWRLSAFAPPPTFAEIPVLAAASSTPTPIGTRSVRLTRAAAVEVPVYRRSDLGAGSRFDGPAIVEERETTAVIRAGWACEVLPDGVILATFTGDSGATAVSA